MAKNRDGSTANEGTHRQSAQAGCL